MAFNLLGTRISCCRCSQLSLYDHFPEDSDCRDGPDGPRRRNDIRDHGGAYIMSQL